MINFSYLGLILGLEARLYQCCMTTNSTGRVYSVQYTSTASRILIHEPKYASICPWLRTPISLDMRYYTRS